ncbi:MAG: hypothetical protein OQJ97_04090 [Rhodospirillales bacterium]|nr:hypothetical protein [Rhodospirillales bacterium]
MASAEPVEVKGGVHPGYGRLVFNWGVPTPYTATVEGDQLTVLFRKNIEADYGQAVRALRKYIRSATPTADGQGVVLTLTKKIGLRDFDMGRSVVVDLMDDTGEGPEPTPTPKAKAETSPESAPAKASTKGPTIGVRSGQHKDYSRLVFDWPTKVDYKLEDKGSTATIEFARGVNLNLKAVNRRLPRNVKGIKASTQDDKTVVTLDVTPGSGFKHFLSGPKVVVDVLNPTAKRIAEAAKKKTEKPVVQPAPPAAKPETKKEDTKAVEPKTPPAVPTKPVTVAGKLETPDKEALKPGEKPVVAKPGEEGTAPLTKLPGEAGKPIQLTAETEAATGPEEFTLSFPWNEPVAAAIFRRSGTLWVVFDRHSTPNIAGLKEAAGGVIRDIIKLPVDRATALRLVLPEDINPRIGRNGFDWVLQFKRQPLKPQNVIDSKSEKLPGGGSRMFMPVSQAGLAIPLRDQNTGDNLVVVPLVPLGQGIGQERDYVEFKVLPSAQGIAIEPKIDDLRVRPFIQGVELTSQTALNVTPLDAKLEAAAKIAAPSTMSRVFQFRSWQITDLKEFNENRQNLQYNISKTKGPEREKARMALGRFFLSFGMGHEADAILRLMLIERPEVTKDVEFAALRGAAKFLKGRYKTAIQEFSREDLSHNDEARYWLASSYASDGNLNKASENLRRFGGIIRTYPRKLKMPLGALSIETAIASGDVKAAERFLDMLKLEEPTPREQGQLAYLQGRVLELGGNVDEAVKKWEEAQDGAHRPSRAKAAYARAEVLRVLEKITNKEAIEELEKLRFAWRGDDFEFNLLRKLGVLYFTEKNYRKALLALKEAATNFRKHPRTPEITQEMSGAFEKLYLDGEADKVSPIKAIALYEEFKELTPAGDKGDLMIRRLADRLVSVDLLDRAAKLLENQVSFRLKGEQKAKVGAKLALIYMMNRNLEEALKTITNTDSPGIPDELAVMRRHLQARTLMELKRNDEALLTLGEDESKEADLIRSEMFWRSQKWPDAAQSLQRIVKGENIEKDSKLTEKQMKYILNLGVALVLGGNERGLARAREKYTPLMAGGPYEDAYQLITSASSRGLIDFRSVSRRVKEVESFQTFMAAYEARLKAVEDQETAQK